MFDILLTAQSTADDADGGGYLSTILFFGAAFINFLAGIVQFSVWKKSKNAEGQQNRLSLTSAILFCVAGIFLVVSGTLSLL